MFLVAPALVVVALAAALAVASEYSDARRFLKKWLVCAVAVMGLATFGALLGEVMLSALCARVWVCK